MPLGYDELRPILDEVQSKVFLANQDGTLPELMSSLGLSHLLSPTDDYGVQNNPRGEIIVLGALHAPIKELQMVANKKGISKNRLRFVEYEEVKTVDCTKWKYSYSVAAMLYGELPHKGKGMGDSSSLRQSLKDNPGPTPFRPVGPEEDPVITKTSFNKALDELLETGILECA